jgi:hypothetical protein
VGYLCGVVEVKGSLGCFIGGLDTIFWPINGIMCGKGPSEGKSQHNMFINNFDHFWSQMSGRGGLKGNCVGS